MTDLEQQYVRAAALEATSSTTFEWSRYNRERRQMLEEHPELDCDKINRMVTDRIGEYEEHA